jgi:sugar phosphate isomerase/epimerase
MILSSQTIAARSFEERVDAAAEAGYTGIGLRPKDYQRARASGLSDADMCALLDDRGITVVEHQALRDWAGGDGRASEEELFAVADALGGTYVIALAAELPASYQVVAERLAHLADRAAAHGLTVALEFMPWSDIHDAATSWNLVRMSEHPGAGVLVDSWHFFRGKGRLEQLRIIPPERVVAVHLADADAAVVGTLPEDTISRRRVPGEGDLPLVDFVRTLDETGVHVDFAVEVLSEEQRALPAMQAALLAADGARRTIASARA